MSWAEENGGVELEENPDPEEDSDLPQRQHQDGEEVGFRSEEDGPEEDLAMSQENVVEAQNIISDEVGIHLVGGEDLNSESAAPVGGASTALTNAQCGGAEETCAILDQDNNEKSIVDGDSFEQDEAAAAPECENDVRCRAFSESDRQQFQFEVISKSETDTQNDTIDFQASELSFLEHGQDAQDVVSNINSDEVVITDTHHQNLFSGDVEIVNSFDDAPEAEVGNLKQGRGAYMYEEEDNLHLFSDHMGSGSSNFTISSLDRSGELEEADAVLDVRIVASTSGNESEQTMHECTDPQLQAPECDRETASFQISEEHQEPSQPDLTVASCDNNSADQQSTLGQAEVEDQGQATHECSVDIAETVSSNDVETQRSAFPSPSNVSSPQEYCVSQDLSGAAVVAEQDKTDSVKISSTYSDLTSTSDRVTESTDDCTGGQQSMPSSACLSNHLSHALIDDHVETAELPGHQANSSSTTTTKHSVKSANSTDTKSAENRLSTSFLSQSLGISNVKDQQSPIPKVGSQLYSSGSSSQTSTPVTSQHSSPSREHSGSVVMVSRNQIDEELALALQSDDEDELLHELDAELLAHASRFKSAHRSGHEHASGQSRKGNFGPSVNGFQPSFDFAQIHEHNRQLLEQLKLRDEEIGRLTRERDSIKETLTQVQSQVAEQQNVSSHSTEDIHLFQISTLENTVTQQQNEIKVLKEKLLSHDSAAKRAVTTLQGELKSRVDQITKMYEECLKEKDMMVVKFAESEAKSLEAKRIIEKNDAKLKEVMKEKDNLANALKAAASDKQKAIMNCEAKSTEVSNLQKELEKLKEAVNSSEYRIKWFQNKLKDELESHKETKSSLEKVTAKLKEAREETEIIRKECQAIVKRYQESEEIKSNSLDKELKLKENELRTQMQEKFDTEEIHQLTKRELESLKAQHKDTIEEHKAYKDKVHCLEEERKQNHQMIENHQEIMQRQKTEISDLRIKVKSLTTLEDDYKRAQDMIHTLDKDINELKISNRDLQKDVESCRERESKMLTLQSELSRTSALLRSENTNLSNKASNLMAEVEKLKMEVQELETTVKDLSDKYEEEKTKRKDEVEKFETTMAEKTKECNDLKQKWEDEIDNSKTLKRKHANSVKDLTRQLHHIRKRLETLEEKGEASSMGSRTNSNGSLNSIENSSQQSAVVHQQPIQEFPVITEQVEVDKQILIERIVRLQKAHARKNEKLEFLSEHIQQLLDEIRKKNKIIQSYALREESGTLSSEDMDANKEKVVQLYKAEVQSEIQTLLARKGGIMASLYSVHQQDGSMTLELSLQINRKLQAVFEDTLLKNITLKENLDTLGEEIARLSQENRQLQLHIQEVEGRLT